MQTSKLKQRMPRWLRVSVVLMFLALSGVVGYVVYDYTTRPKTLSIAVGSVDGDAVRLLSTLATRMAATNSPVQLRVVDAGTPLKAAEQFAKGEVDLAIARADIGDLSSARTVVTVANATMLILAPAGAGVSDMGSLRNKTIGVIGLDTNQKIIDALSREYDLAAHKTTFRPLLPGDAVDAFKQRRIQALIVVLPLTERYMATVRMFAQGMPKGRMVIVPVDSAGAIAELDKAYESFDMPKGTLRGSPPLPDDDMTTLRVPYYMVANAKLEDSAVNDLAKAIMNARRALIQQNPLLAQIAAPSSDKDAYIAIHPGAQAYFDGDETTLLDKYGDLIWYGSMALGALTSLFAALLSFISKDVVDPEGPVMERLYALMDRVDLATASELVDIEKSVNRILKDELEKLANGSGEEGQANAVNLAIRRLEYLVAQRRAALRDFSAGGQAPAAPATAEA